MEKVILNNGSRILNNTFRLLTIGARLDNTTSSNNTCNLLPATNSSLPIAPRWENIPETLVLNGIVGLFLLSIFLVLTKRAWSQANSSHKSHKSLAGHNRVDKGLISFLYGYRDPENWYVIPRFEFLRYKDRHHNHVMDYPNIYAPPKLPLASPNELLMSDAAIDDDSDLTRSKSVTKTLHNDSNVDKTKKEEEQLKTAKKSTIVNIIPSATDAGNPVAGKKPKPLEAAFFYPSILTAEQMQASSLSRKLNRFFAMFFRVTDADIIYAKGIDAYEYLLFQRHLILIMFITNVFCLGIILPIHWYSGANQAGGVSSFQQSTMKNIDPNSSLYWAHIGCSISIVSVTMYILKSYRQSTIAKNDTQLARRTLLIGNIPKHQRKRVRLMKIFKDNFPKCNVEAIQFVYDTSPLETYQMELSAILVAREYCEHYKRKYGKELMVKQTEVNENQYCSGYCRLCSFVYVCCCYWPRESRIPGTIFYAKEESRYRDKIKKAFEDMVKSPSEYAFVTLKSYRQAKRFMEHLTALRVEAQNNAKNAKKSGPGSPSISSNSLNTMTTPHQSPVESDDSESSHKSRTALATTKLSDPKSPDKNNQQVADDPMDARNNPHVKSIRSPSAIKRSGPDSVMTSKMANDPNANLALLKSNPYTGPVTWSVRYAPHPDNVEFRDILHIATTSRFTIVFLHLVMVVIFIFFTTPNVLLSVLERYNVLRPEKAEELTGFQGMFINYLSTLIQIITTALLPSLIQLISKQLPYEDSASKNHSMMWKVYAFLILMVIIMPSVGMSSAQAFMSSEINPKCLFPTDNGAYFINYVLSSVFLSTILELIKPTDIIFYCFILWTARSFADFEGGRQYIGREFSVGMQHTSVLLIFAVVMTYTISCPLIAPAGLIYLIVKHAVDHYHLFYTYFTKKVDESLQTTIIIFVRLSLLLMLFQTTVSISINTGVGYFSLISQIVFWITLAIFSFDCFFECTSKAMITGKRNRFQREFCACFYMPRVIGDLLRCNAIPETCVSRQV